MTKKSLTITAIPDACQAFQQALAQYLGLQNHEIAPLKIQFVDDLRLETNEQLKGNSFNGRYQFWHPDTYSRYYIPHANSQGIYFFFDQNDIAVYVGKAESAGGIGARVAAHIGKLDEGKFFNLDFKESKCVGAIPMDNAGWLAPAFESWLLQNYCFEYNRSLSNYSR